MQKHKMMLLVAIPVTMSLGLLAQARVAYAQIALTPHADMVLDTQALVYPDTASFGRDVNGSPYRTEPLVTFGDYQFATWYHAGPGTGDNSQENIYISRRHLSGNTWETIDTGQQMLNGDNSWDSHNVISMGISNDGRIHLAYDMHKHGMRYLSSQAGKATTSSANWNDPGFTIFNSERDSLNFSGTGLTDVTYPRFVKNGDDMLLTYRSGGSGNGDTVLARYDSDGSTVHSRWVDVNGNNGANVTQTIISGSTGSYTSPFQTPETSNNRNAYLNGMDVGPDGKIHMTWTWRENSQGSNHDINYAFSDNNGATWKNNSGQNLGATISINSPGIIVESLDLHQALINQQGQAVDNDGGVHALMYHRRQEPGFEWQIGDGLFFKGDSAYFHHYRDPVTGQWTESMLPTDRPVGSRPSIGFDGENNLYAAYVSRAGGNDILTIAMAEKMMSSGYMDWKIVLEDHRDWAGTPLLDQTRLLDDGIISIYLQQDTSLAGRTGTNLHVLEFAIATAVPEPSSFAVLSISCLSLVVFRRRRRIA
ncbi:hypothetical protein CA13_07260 [Planctomycetes bacterium CA13]|uniref:BNR/Asp-box repeat protein n=1 Tax=Novipirellula herctigrandis TaxID=2527986 RepID=A0A5C5YXP3_9BACT|nr:hypothetical protein CA13_07260 [Planctomycetes bacterium CA13]